MNIPNIKKIKEIKDKKGLAMLILVLALIVFLLAQKVQIGSNEPIVVRESTEINAVVADDQDSGSMIHVASVSLAEGGFVVMHDDKSGFPMDILGVSEYLAPGVYKNVTVPLEIRSIPGDKMIVVIHLDNGNGVFAPADDYSIQDSEGNNILAPITIK
ncbi:MAG: hypothetical protein KAR24_01655 [Candidatus Pacebacteria bacterium]|nr:hypothetical protein [Candidatus Paceibacterota bacterium]